MTDHERADTEWVLRSSAGEYSSAVEGRRIIHVDMDAFYAQIEQRDFPDRYAGKPVTAGDTPPRGVVQTASHGARPYGVHSARPAIRTILYRHTDLVESLSLDETYLDVTDLKTGPPSGTLIARRIRRDIQRETGLTAPAGVGPSKFVATHGGVGPRQARRLTVIPPEQQAEFIAILPIEDFHGIGPVTPNRMKALGLERGHDLQEVSERRLVHPFGRWEAHFKTLAVGEDRRPVTPDRRRKSVGAERTFRDDIGDPAEMLWRLEAIADTVA